MMKRTLVLTLAVIAFCLPVGASAQFMTEKPVTTKPPQIAMIYQRLTQQRPDFPRWIEQMPDYIDADLHDRVTIMEERTREMQKDYNLTMPTEPIVVEARVPIAGYGRLQQAFMAPMFNELTFFSYGYMGQFYAVVPRNLTKFHWLHIPEAQAMLIHKEMDSQRTVKALLRLTPLQADRTPLRLNGRNYHLLMANITALEIWSQDGTRIIWNSRKMMPEPSLMPQLH